jgi:hypothetical protein
MRQTVWKIAHSKTWAATVTKHGILATLRDTGEIVPGVEIRRSQRLDVR